MKSTAIVTKATGSWYTIRDENQKIWNARLRGQLKVKGTKATNLITVGDKVSFEIINNENAQIYELLERKNYIIRRASNLSKLYHIVASNLDEVSIISSISNPELSIGMLDRLLTTAEAYQINANIILSKKDLWGKEHFTKAEELIQIYEPLGYKVIQYSSQEMLNINELQSFFENKTTLLIGQSGVGKSSLIKKMIPNAEPKIANISDWNKKGKHCTTFSEMYFINKTTSLIDTPGLREFALVDINKNEIGHFFPEFRERLNECQFNDCSHINEKQCAVIMAVKEQQICKSRYRSYMNLYFQREKESNKNRKNI